MVGSKLVPSNLSRGPDSPTGSRRGTPEPAWASSRLHAQQREISQLTLERQQLLRQARDLQADAESARAESERLLKERKQTEEERAAIDKARDEREKRKDAELKALQATIEAAKAERGALQQEGGQQEIERYSDLLSKARAELTAANTKLEKAERSLAEGGEGGAEGSERGGAPSPAPKEGGVRGGASPAKGADRDKALEEAKAAEEELRVDLELAVRDLRAMLDLTPMLVCALDPLGFVTGWNQTAVDITNFSRDELLNQHFVECAVVEDAQEAVADAMEAAFTMKATHPLADEASEPFELKLRRGGGCDGVLAIQVRAFTRRTREGLPVGLLLLQENALTANVEHHAHSAAESERAEMQIALALRDDEIEHLEGDLEMARRELRELYKQMKRSETPSAPVPKSRAGRRNNRESEKEKATKDLGRAAKGVSWSGTNKVASFTRGSSAVSFGQRAAHEEARAQALGLPGAPMNDVSKGGSPKNKKPGSPDSPEALLHI